MNKLVHYFFNFLRNCLYLVKIIIVFNILMLIFYWIQKLTGNIWAWTKFTHAFLDFFIMLGEKISSGSMMLFQAVFEFKYFFAGLIFGGLYLFIHLLYLGINMTEEICSNTQKIVRRFEENEFNKKLAKQETKEQKKINKYQVYVSASVKPKFAYREFNIDINEQKQILLKHLVKTLEQCPQHVDDGYLFTFDNFERIDFILNVFKKLPESKAPIDYIICVQILSEDAFNDKKKMNKMISLKYFNKIITMADTVYRYGFNLIQNYGLSQLGVFQNEDNNTFELYEFKRKD